MIFVYPNLGMENLFFLPPQKFYQNKQRIKFFRIQEIILKSKQDGRTIGKKATHAQKEHEKKIHEKNEKKEVSKL